MSITTVLPAPSSSEDCTARKLGDLRPSDFVKTCLIIADFASALVHHDLSLRERDSLHELRIDPLASRIGTRQPKRMAQNLYAAGSTEYYYNMRLAFLLHIAAGGWSL